MEFDTAAQEACYNRVMPWMQELFGAFALEFEDYPRVGIAVGSAFAVVSIHPFGDDEATVATRAYVVTGARFDEHLFEWLLHQNDEMRFGSFGIDDDNDIFFKHSLLGTTLDKDELKSSVLSVVMTADSCDDPIIQRWGGKRALDRLLEGAMGR